MSCEILIYDSVIEQDTMHECGEPELIPGVCYDHCVLCNKCGNEPAHPDAGVCNKCELEETNNV